MYPRPSCTLNSCSSLEVVFMCLVSLDLLCWRWDSCSSHWFVYGSSSRLELVSLRLSNAGLFVRTIINSELFILMFNLNRTGFQVNALCSFCHHPHDIWWLKEGEKKL